MHRDKDYNETKTVKTKKDGSITTTMPDGTTATTSKAKTDGQETKIGKPTTDADSNKTTTTTDKTTGKATTITKMDGSKVTTNPDKSTIITKLPAGGGTLAVYKDARGKETERVETPKDGSSITTKADGTKHLVIPSSVTSIGKEVFSGNKLTSVSIPASVTSIGGNAFYDNKMTEVILPKKLYDKKGNAFDDNPVGLKFYAYDASKTDKKGNPLNLRYSVSKTLCPKNEKERGVAAVPAPFARAAPNAWVAAPAFLFLFQSNNLTSACL